MSIPLLCIALLALLNIGLAFTVSSYRSKDNVIFGYSEDPENTLYKAVRAHGNTAEYVPILALLIYILGQFPETTWVLWCMILVTFFRYLAAMGILFAKTLAKPNPMRFVGALGTYITGFALCAALLLRALNV
ncbi:MAPEG family protein [Oceanicoccus sp. KOV_DT_Chl]|uniref:MAPEG family protein n=1 Tax=Oceanicoccus sp. KOV_DT_Chl TaxID=1904639 RepID=UPI000C7D7945|nr:MAPEG family protein [Oceanicoccus sp. KOV_DT_Chl]